MPVSCLWPLGAVLRKHQIVSLPVSRYGWSGGIRLSLRLFKKLLPVKIFVMDTTGNNIPNKAAIVKNIFSGGFVSWYLSDDALDLASFRSSGLRMVKLLANKLCASINWPSILSMLKPIKGLATNINTAKEKSVYNVFSGTVLFYCYW